LICIALKIGWHNVDALSMCRAQADFLPVALVLGLVPGQPVEVPIVIVAEDGVTSLRYYLRIVRDAAPATNTSAVAAAPGSSGSHVRRQDHTVPPCQKYHGPVGSHLRLMGLILFEP
jgi:hypothetical protein